MQRSVSFIMLPIYTRCLTPADYGVIELLSMIIDFAGIIFGLRVSQSIFRYYYKYDGRGKDEVISTSLYLVLLANVLGALVLICFSHPLSLAIFGDQEQSGRLSLFAVTMLSQGAISIPMIGLRAAQRPFFFVIISSVKLIIQLSLNIYFVVVKGLHVDGVIYSSLIATLICGASLSFYTFYVRGMRCSLGKAKELASFSLPLVLSDVIGFYVTFGDRYFLRIFSGLGEVGIYSLGYKFGFLLSFLITQPFNSIWDTVKYEIATTEGYKKEYNKIFLIFSLVLILACLTISVFIKDFFVIMADPSFLIAYKIVPIVLAAYLMNAWCSYVNLSVLLMHKPMEIFNGTVVAVLVSTCGYLIFIPLWGATGAAVSALFAFGARLVWVYLRGKKLFDMGIKWRCIVPLMTLFVSAVIISSFPLNNLYLSIVFHGLVLFVALLVIYYFPVIPAAIKKDIIKYCKKRLAIVVYKVSN